MMWVSGSVDLNVPKLQICEQSLELTIKSILVNRVPISLNCWEGGEYRGSRCSRRDFEGDFLEEA